jgi:hypothetical protein
VNRVAAPASGGRRIATSNPALVHLRTGTPTIQLKVLVDRAVMKARGVRCVVWVHLAGMRVPGDQGSVAAGFWVLECGGLGNADRGIGE